MNDNLLYINAWMNYNPEFQEHLKVEGTRLIYSEDGLSEEVPIGSFYLPEMLYNENFRNQISMEHELSAKDFFQIVKLYVETQEILEKEQQELSLSPTIENIELRKKDGQEFLVFTDNFQRKYRYDTKEPEKVINFYLDLKNTKGSVSLKEFGSVIQNGES